MNALPPPKQVIRRWKPSLEHTLLLRAALWEDDAAHDAWKEWRRQVQSTKLNPGERRLLPLVYLNLREKDSDPAALEYPAQIYREFRESNREIMRNAAAAIRILQQAGIPTLVLKAMALIPLYYHDPGARPTRDMDILVPTEMGRAALAVLSAAGWMPQNRALEAFDEAYLARYYAHTLQNSTRLQLDLHRHVLQTETRPNGDADFWANAIPVQFESIETLALAPADQLLHTCVHGRKWNSIVAPLRWAADAYTILVNAPVDWDRLLEQSEKCQVVMTMRSMLSYLHDELAAPIPDGVLDALYKLPVTRYDRVQDELGEHNTIQKLWYHYYQYRALRDSYADIGILARFPRFLRDTWELENTRQVPKYMASFLYRRVKHSLHQMTHPTQPVSGKDKA